ncbi:leucine-rich repeat domain-containing protein [Candidatus Thorarchaeota archaeon]|nr:MAG: leucine-rich repeat domain-containing protein [Candidatus Thorarchaeota archaeon]
MNEILTPERKAFRESIKGMNRIGYSGPITKEVIEDFIAAAPGVQLLTVDVIDDTVFDLRMLTPLKELLTLTINEGAELKEILLDGIQECEVLMGFEINVNPEETIEEIDLTPLKNHPELGVVTIACPVKNIKGLDVLGTIPNLHSIGFYSLDIPEFDLSALSSCTKLDSIFLGDIGPESPTKPYRITLPKNAHIKLFEASECYSEDLEIEIDFSFLEGIESMDSLGLVNCNLTSFDLSVLSTLKRLGKLDLSNNKITHLDVTPILEMPMFTEKALGEPPFLVDEDVVIQIAKRREQNVVEIIGIPDKVIDDHDGHFAIEYEFGHKWLKNLIDTNRVEWI